MRHADRMRGNDVTIDDAKTLYERAQQRYKQHLKNEENAKNVENLKILQKKIDQKKKSIFDNGNDEKDIVPSTPNYIEPGSEEEERWKQKLEYAMDLVSLNIYAV